MGTQNGLKEQIFRAGLLESCEVHQAAGMTAAQLTISPPEAIARLRAYAEVSQRSLDQIARDVLDRSLRMGDDGSTSNG